METAIIGAGPTGLFLGMACARRGHRVTVVDRDGGPGQDGRWERRGVMQFHHAHALRPQIGDALRAETPAAYDRLEESGVEVMRSPEEPDVVLGMRARRETFERALRSAAVETPGLTLRVGHVQEVVEVDGRAAGLRVDGARLTSDLVIDASGRSGRVTRHLRAVPSAGGPCGIAYVDRQYQLLPGAEPGPMVNPIAWQADLPGYQVILFLHERGIFSVLVVRPTDARDLVDLRHVDAFQAACRAIPGLSEWTDPTRSRPLTPVLPGGPLMNWYRSQRGPDGSLALPGLFFVGDSVCTTTPIFGRGITTSFLQASELLRLLDDTPTGLAGLTDAGEAFDSWCETQMRPWVVDHQEMDEANRRRMSGGDIDLDARIPSDLIMAAARVDSAIAPYVGPYLTMAALPEVLDPAEPLARAVYESGWRPEPAPGPTRGELARVVARVAASR